MIGDIGYDLVIDFGCKQVNVWGNIEFGVSICEKGFF